jgi:DNA-binding response OmpR family regulator
MENRLTDGDEPPHSGRADGAADGSHDRGKPGEVLVGISDPEVLRAVMDAFEELEHDVVAVTDGFHLVEKMADEILDERHGCRPSLIVADALLPGCTGLSLLAGLRELSWGVPVVLLAPQDDEAVRRRAWECGASGVFLRPFEPRELMIFCRLLLEPDDTEAYRSMQSSETMNLDREVPDLTIRTSEETERVGASTHG